METLPVGSGEHRAAGLGGQGETTPRSRVSNRRRGYFRDTARHGVDPTSRQIRRRPIAISTKGRTAGTGWDIDDHTHFADRWEGQATSPIARPVGDDRPTRTHGLSGTSPVTATVAPGPSPSGRPPVLVATSAAASALGSARRRLRWASWHRTRCHLFDLQLDAEVAEVQQRLAVTRARVRHHDVVNALTAVEGAATILARESLSAADRSKLAGLLGSGLGRLHTLLVVVEPAGDRVVLADVATAVAEELAWRDRVHVDVSPDLVVAGRPDEIAETVRQLIVHASRRAPSRPIAVKGRRHGGRTELWVQDQGPRLSARERRRIREPARGRLFRPVTVGPLHVAIRLARAQGADVRIESSPGGGASTGISWETADGQLAG